MEDDPALTSPQLWVGRMRRDAADALRYGCDGLLGIHWRTRVLGPNVSALAQAAWNQQPWLETYKPSPPQNPPGPISGPETMDFYADWAGHEFGPLVGAAAAKIFEKLDCRLPVPSVWTDGPGGIKPDNRSWDRVKKDYSFVDDFAGLRAQIQGRGNLERFEYWLSTFEYFRAIAEVNCAWGEYDQIMARVKAEQVSEAQRRLARDQAVPARQKLVRLTRALFEHLLATVSTTGELGTVANWNQHNLPILLTKPAEELVKILGEPLPPECCPDMQYHGPTRLIVPTRRTNLAGRVSLDLKIIVLSEKSPRAALIYWRELGSGKFTGAPLWRVARSVYSVTIPPTAHGDLEYYIQVETDDGKGTCFPATAPEINQTVIYCTGPGSS
jgi:hypothetical protein